MKNKLIWIIAFFLIGIVLFLLGGKVQYAGGLVIAIGFFLVDLYVDERKLAKTGKSK